MSAIRRVGIRQRFILFLFSFFVVLFAGIAALLVTRTAISERNNLNQQTKSFATLATKPISDAFLLYKDSGKVRIEQQVNKFIDLDSDITGVAIIDTYGKILYYNGQIPDVRASQANTFETIYNVQSKIIKQVIDPVIEDYGVHRYAVVYSVSDKRIVQDTQRTVGIIVILSIFAFALAIGLTYWLINRLFLSPVRTISAKALKISNGDLEDQISLKRNDEIGDLAQAVNTMASSLKADIVKLQEADKLKSEFITISSHNLRTPLTVIKGDLEIMREMGVPDKLETMIGDVTASAAHLNNFVEDLLAISSMESGKLAASQMEPLGVKELLEAVAMDYTQVAKNKKLQFKVDLKVDEQKVVMSRHLLRMAFVNLLENAFKFTKEGSVSLSAAIEHHKLVVKVSDTGTGIAENEMPKLFTKFHRGTDVMRYDYEGTGIGLYLTKLIVTDHHGSVSADSTEGKGATFTVILPLAD